jgi:hypothetical protein
VYFNLKLQVVGLVWVVAGMLVPVGGVIGRR